MLYFDPGALYSILTSNPKRTRNTALASKSSLVMVQRNTSDNSQLWQFQPVKDASGANVDGCWTVHVFDGSNSLKYCLTRSNPSTGLLAVEQIKTPPAKGVTTPQMWYIASTNSGEGKWTLSDSPKLGITMGTKATILDVGIGTDTVVAFQYTANTSSTQKPQVEDTPWEISYVKAAP
jgi:hypothetical protein